MSPAARQWARDRADDAFQLVGLAVTLGVIIFAYVAINGGHP